MGTSRLRARRGIPGPVLSNQVPLEAAGGNRALMGGTAERAPSTLWVGAPSTVTPDEGRTAERAVTDQRLIELYHQTPSKPVNWKPSNTAQCSTKTLDLMDRSCAQQQ